MYIKNKQEMMALLKLIGYVEDKEVPKAWRPKMVCHNPKRPTVYMLWVNGCTLNLYKDTRFLTFSEAWKRINHVKRRPESMAAAGWV